MFVGMNMYHTYFTTRLRWSNAVERIIVNLPCARVVGGGGGRGVSPIAYSVHSSHLRSVWYRNHNNFPSQPRNTRWSDEPTKIPRRRRPVGDGVRTDFHSGAPSHRRANSSFSSFWPPWWWLRCFTRGRTRKTRFLYWYVWMKCDASLISIVKITWLSYHSMVNMKINFLIKISSIFQFLTVQMRLLIE